MGIARLAGSAVLTGVLAVATGCSENNELLRGTFVGRLSGTRNETLSGSAVAGTVFTEEGVAYSISLVEPGAEDVLLSIFCPGEDTPGVGSHPIGDTEDCSATYRRTIDDPLNPIERADAVLGTLVLRSFEDDAVSGRIDFTGPLDVGEIPSGDLTASADFVARPIGGSPSLRPISARAFDANADR